MNIDISRKDIKVSIVQFVCTFLFFLFFFSKDNNEIVDVFFPVLLLSLIGLLTIQIRFHNKTENQSGRSYFINNLFAVTSILLFLALLAYFSYQIGFDIAEILNRPVAKLTS